MRRISFIACFRFTRFVIAASLVLFIGAPAWADQFPSLGFANDAGVVALGSGKTLAINSGPITGGGVLGGVFVGNNINVQLNGGNNGAIPDGLFTDGTAVIGGGGLDTPPTITMVSPSVTTSALASALEVSNFAAGLTPTQTFGNITGTTTIFGGAASGINVINVANINNAPLTISGTSKEIFVFNVSGGIQTNQAMTLTGGVTANQLLFNLTGKSGNVFQTSGGDVSYGTYLATNGGSFQFSNLNLTGGLINTAGDVQFVSGSKLTFPPGGFISQFPEPTAVVGMLGLAGMGLISLVRYRRQATTG